MKHLTVRTLSVMGLLLASLAWSLDIDSAKADGLVGERADGYLGAVVEPVGPEVAALVEEVNSKRRAEYERIAQANGLSVREVEALAGKKTLAKTPSGGWIFVTDWKQK